MGCAESKRTTTTTEGPTQYNPGNVGGRYEPNLHQQKRKKKPKPDTPQFSVDDPTGTSHRTPHPLTRPLEPQRQPILTPNDPGFRVSANGRNNYKVTDVYRPAGQELGKGTFGSVYRADHIRGERNQDWSKVAIKLTSPTILDKRMGKLHTYDDIEARCQEIKTLLRLREGPARYSCVLYVYEYFWTYRTDGKGELVLVTELLGQELDQWRQEQAVFHESSARTIGQTLIQALDFMHQRGVVHRDLKLQNVLFRRNGDFGSLKVVDFGLAKVLDGAQANDFCGSLGYISPEMYQNMPYGYEVDMFAMGVIIFRLLSGIRPFASTNNEKLKHDTINLRYTVQGKTWEGVSPEALKLVRKLLIGREERLTAAQAIDHEWFNVQEESVLNPDYAQDRDYKGNDSYSKAMVQSQAPEAPRPGSANQFWLDGKLDHAINLLLSYGLYVGRILDSSREEQGELIFVEESVNTSLTSLPAYVARLQLYTERECRRICREAAQIIKISHDSKMAHRNIHMNNFVVDHTGKLLVRGLSNAQAVEEDQPLTGHFGYLYSWYAFKAPEIDNDFFHDKTVDIWSLGAFIYMMLTALPPFRGDGADLIANKHNGNVVFDTVLPSGPAQRLVRSLLQVNPADRPSIEQVLDAEWMIEADDILANHDLSLAKAFLSDWEQRPNAR